MAENKKKDFNLNKLVEKIGIEKIAIIGICGAILIFMPTKSNKKNSIYSNDNYKKSNTIDSEATDDLKDYSSSIDKYCEEMENKLEEILAKTKGVGNVSVFITADTSYERVVLFEEKTSEEEKTDNNKSESSKAFENTAVYYDKKPYVIKEIVPRISGVYVVAEGGNNSEVILKITEIIKSLFGIEAHKIVVAGME